MDHTGTGDVKGIGFYRIFPAVDSHAAFSPRGVMDLIAGIGVGVRRDDRTKLLDAHIRGRKVEPLVDLAFPRIVTRQSTDETIVPDRFIAKALAIVRKDLSVNHTVGDLAQTLNISRRTLEMKSNLVLGTTLKSEINRIRLNEAVRLISNTDLPVWAIAEKCGFCCASHLNTRFKTAFGHSPSVFRYRNPS